MADAKMVKVEQPDEPMHGSRKILVCGYSALEQEAFCEMIEHEGIEDAGIVFGTPSDGESALSELFCLEGRCKMGEEGRMPRAVIMGGISEKELHKVMAGRRELGLPWQLWAVLPPESEEWTLRQLISELQRESEKMR